MYGKLVVQAVLAFPARAKEVHAKLAGCSAVSFLNHHFCRLQCCAEPELSFLQAAVAAAMDCCFPVPMRLGSATQPGAVQGGPGQPCAVQCSQGQPKVTKGNLSQSASVGSPMGVWSSVSMLQGLAALACPVPRALLLETSVRLRPHLDWLTPEQQVQV